MKGIGKLALALAAALMLSACMGNVQTYVDPQYHRATYASIHKAAHPVPVNVTAHFQENGRAKPSVDRGLHSDVVYTLRRSGVFRPVADGDPASGTITVVANNLADIGAAKDKGRSVGFTLGASGTTVQDRYVFDVSYSTQDGAQFRHRYNHRLISTIGHADGPKDLKPTNLANGFRQVVQDVILNFIQDWQRAEQVAQRR